MDNSDFNIALIPAYAEVITAEGITDKVRELRFSALRKLQGYLNHYKKLGYMDCLLYSIAEKKSEMILSVTSKAEMESVVKPRCPHYDGNKFIPDAYHVPEEELICWSETSLRSPLNEAEFKRYRELFREVFPEESKELSI